jgi:arylsulfatase A-like enzyme
VASFVLLGTLGLVVANPDKAEGQAGVRLVQTSPVWKRVTNHTVSREEFLRSAKALGLGDFEAAGRTYPASARRDLNVVLIFLESSYNKHLSLFGSSEETQPLLSKYKDRMEVFPNFFSSFAGSIQARFATFTGLYPVRDFNAFTMQRVNVKSLFDVFHDNGYASSLFYSSFVDYTGFRDFLKNRGIDELYDADTMPGPRKTERVSWGLREGETLGAIRNQIKRYAGGNQRFFLTYVPAAPHYPYDCIPEAFHHFKPCAVGDFTPMYLNELLYMDWVMASIVDELRESGVLDKTLVVITDDHGEMLGANDGPIGHGWVITPELANAPLIIMDPQNPGYHLNYTLGSQIDLLPTLLDLLKISVPPSQLYEGRSLYGPEAGDHRLVYLNSYEQYGVITRSHFVAGNRKTDEGGASSLPGTVYAISNQGAKTLFTADSAAKERPVLIRPFDEFQENLLRNYSLYCDSVCKTRQTASLRSRP